MEGCRCIYCGKFGSSVGPLRHCQPSQLAVGPGYRYIKVWKIFISGSPNKPVSFTRFQGMEVETSALEFYHKNNK